ncbi:hypothetical protein M7I_5553 [Glarea lozoyensis 74030]|uniref:Large ribosomal subunit protein mL50 n=1 Tax=Glarea lozoyensis (strain ATCC 74030 / MF5533) TaxID=1104152 RepID=H0ES75_GLAL7|nr:hypothetical protein M7I_5553 [Glarea lozoyensis 74030]
MSLSGAKFKPFAPRTVVEDSHELIAALHQAVVDVFTLKNTGKPYSDLVRLPKKLMLDRARSAKIVPTEDGAALEYEEQGAADKVFGDVEVDAHLEDPASQAEVERNLVAKDSQRARDLVKSFDKAWLDVPLRDLDLKFALLKRVFRLTGVKFPDSQVQNLHTVRFILSKMLKKPEPTKLVGVLTRNVDLKALSNVSISPTRITKTAKSKKLGELKLINAELERKGLPVGVVRNQSNKFQIRRIASVHVL